MLGQLIDSKRHAAGLFSLPYGNVNSPVARGDQRHQERLGMSENKPDPAAVARWLIAQIRDSTFACTLISALQREGWSRKDAVHEVDRLCQGHAATAAGYAVDMPEPVLVPDPAIVGESSLRVLDGRIIQVLAHLRSPQLTVYGGLLADAECDALVELARARLQPSQTLNEDTGVYESNTARSSRGTFFRRGENALCDRIGARIAALLEWPEECGEDLQLLHYGLGAEYLPHHDYFDPDRPGTEAVLQRGGQRVASVVMYLNTPECGGATTFPEAGFQVGAVKGNAVFFSYDRPHPITRTLHGGAPVVRGEKWIATKWLRQSKFI